MAKLREAVAENKANAAFMSGSRKEISAVKEAVAEVLPAIKKASELRVEAEKKASSAEMKLFLIKRQCEVFFMRLWRSSGKNCLLLV